MVKSYIEEQYKLAILDYKLARSEIMQAEALKTMAQLEQIALQNYGIDYVNSLQKLKN